MRSHSLAGAVGAFALLLTATGALAQTNDAARGRVTEMMPAKNKKAMTN